MSNKHPPVFAESDKFNGKNFYSWGPLIYTSASIQGVTGYLKGDIKDPSTQKRKEQEQSNPESPSPDPSSTSSASPTEWYSESPSAQEWQTRNAWTMGLLIYNIKNPIALGINIGGSAAEAWSSICAQYNFKSSVGQVASETKLRTTRMEEGGDFEEHIQLLQTRKTAAVNAGSEFSDDNWKMIILCSLPKSWTPIISTQYETKTSAETIAKLRLHYMQLCGTEESTESPTQSSVTALQTRSTPHRSFRNRSQLQCTNPNCNRRGHTIENCYWRGGGKEGQFPPGFGQRAGNANQQAPTTTPQARLADASTATQPTLTPTWLCMAMIPAIEDDNSGIEETSVVAMAIATEVNEVQVVGTYLDSGATDHCFVNIGAFEAYTKFDQDKAGMGATKGGSFVITGKGKVAKTVDGQNGKTKLIFNDALHTPTLTANLISVPKLDASKFTITFKGGIAQVTDPSGRHILDAKKDGSGLYAVVFEGEEPGTHALVAKSLRSPASLALWHRRFAHAGISTIKGMASKSLVDGLVITGDEAEGKCEDCVYGKHTVRPFDGTTEPEEEVLKRLYIDLWGPAPVRSLGGAVYLMLISDGGSSVKFPYALPNKSGETTLLAFTQFQAMAERTTGRKIIFVHIDEGSEWWNKDWNAHFDTHGISREGSVPYAHAQNGLAERSIRTVMDAVRSVLVDSGLPHFLWAEAVNFVCYVLGFVPSSRHPGVIPWEKWTGRRQDVSHIRPFGSIAYARVPTELIKSKLDPRSVKLVLIGYYGFGSYRLYDPNTRAIYKSRDVIFEEGRGHRTLPPPPSLPDPEPNTSVPPITTEDSQVIVKSTPLTGIAPRVTDPTSIQKERQREAAITPTTTPGLADGEPTVATTTPDAVSPTPTLARRSSRIAELPAVNYAEKNFTSMKKVLMADADENRVPKSYKEAMKNPDVWGPPTREELLNLFTHEVFELVPRSSVPTGKTIITSGFVYANKYDADGHIAKRKGRVVAKGYLQMPGEDFGETYASVARLESFRMVIAIATTLGWTLWQLDFVAAYLNADIDCDVYMEVPPGYLEMLGDEGVKVEVENPVAKLKKGLYGTMQAGNGWWHELDKSYEGLGYYRSVADSCVRSRSMGGVHTIVSTHTDDVMGASSTDGGAKAAMEELDRCYEAKKTEDPTLILGIEIRKGQETTTISQSSFIIRVLERFNLTSCTIKATPLPTGITLSTSHSPATAEEATWMKTRPYRALLGAIMWVQVGTRPDIAYATNTLARFQSNPGKAHWNALLHLAGYLRGTIDRGITYHKGSSSSLKPFGYVDADYGGDTDTRRSTSGYVFMMGGGPVSWNSKLQPTVALSTSEAEYMGLTRAAQQVLWMNSFMSEVGLPQEFPLTINCDNASSIALASSTKGHSRAKHIDIRYHYIREKVQKEIELQHVPSSSNIADILTKPLPRDLHLQHLDSLLSKGLNGHTRDA